MRPAWLVIRRSWRRLTSMRTALILLFLLAVAAVPGSLLPQRTLNPQKTASYIADHGSWGRFLDSIDMFDVFGSVWFAAIYLLLFVSLIGCLIPRIKVHARALARKPLPAPRNLGRLPESGSFGSSRPAAEYAATARSTLGRRWRVEQRTEESGAITLAAEKGYSRETGNLIFHVSLLAALILIAIGRLYQYEGQVIVTQNGAGFCNSPALYDSFKPGRLAASGDVSLPPFCVSELDKFVATYTADGEPRQFKADITYEPTLNAAPRRASITVNNPLRFEGDRLYLQGHGFAPTVTLRMPGREPITKTQNFLPTDGSTLLSEGVFSFDGVEGAKQDIGLKGVFAPNAVDQATGLSVIGPKSVVTSTSPDTKNPVLSLFVFKGDLNQNGQPRSVYTIDTSKMKQIDAVNLAIGQTVDLPGGGTLTYDGWKPWANFQVSHDPAQSYLLIAAVLMVVGLFGSLGIRRRRLWIRIAPAAAENDGSPTVVTVGGLARSDSGNFTTEFATLLSRLSSTATPADDRAGGPTVSLDDTIGAGKD